VVLQYRERTETTAAGFELSGVFDAKDKAVAACRDWTYSVNGPLKINRQLPHETVSDVIECFYPIQREA